MVLGDAIEFQNENSVKQNAKKTHFFLKKEVEVEVIMM